MHHRHSHRDDHHHRRGSTHGCNFLFKIIEMDKIVSAINQIGEHRVANDDDLVDRLSRCYTTFILVLFAALVSTKQYVGEPINCWVPARFTENHEDYTNKICWVSNTYYKPFNERFEDFEKPRQKIQYYQWIPLILIAQSILFFVPHISWRLLSMRSGVSIKSMVDAGVTTLMNSESHDKNVSFMVNHLNCYLTLRRPSELSMWARIKTSVSKWCCCICGRRYGNYLTSVYMFVKFLYICNSAGQLFLLSLFLGTDYHLFGVHIVTSLIRGESWVPSECFPRVTLCDFEIREVKNVNRHTVQCVLAINLFNEKIYIFVWFWFVLVAFITVISFFHWFIRSYFSSNRLRYVRKQLKSLDRINRETDVQVSKFVTEYLRQDGVFVVHLVAVNAGDLMAAELTAGLFDCYIKDQYHLPDRPNTQNNATQNNVVNIV